MRCLSETCGPRVLSAVSWWTVYAWIETHQCWERRRTNNCGCVRKQGNKRYNPCEVEAKLMEDVSNLATGSRPIHYDLDYLTKWVQHHVCHSHPVCNHKTCHEAAPILSFLAEQQAAARAA